MVCEYCLCYTLSDNPLSGLDKRFTENQLGTIRSIIEFASGDQEVLGLTVDTAWGINKFHIAYILATAEWESGFKPVEEISGKNKPYAPYYGRGYVQLTHKGELNRQLADGLHDCLSSTA